MFSFFLVEGYQKLHPTKFNGFFAFQFSGNLKFIWELYHLTFIYMYVHTKYVQTYGCMNVCVCVHPLKNNNTLCTLRYVFSVIASIHRVRRLCQVFLFFCCCYFRCELSTLSACECVWTAHGGLTTPTTTITVMAPATLTHCNYALC